MEKQIFNKEFNINIIPDENKEIRIDEKIGDFNNIKPEEKINEEEMTTTRKKPKAPPKPRRERVTFYVRKEGSKRRKKVSFLVSK